jgi:hypothetical protein
MNFTTQRHLSRRTFLRGSGIALSLPWLNAMLPAFAAAPTPPRRMINVLNYFSFHAPNLFPKESGPNYTPTTYLDVIQEHRSDFTLISGLNNPEVRDGHNSDKSFFTGAPHPSSPSFRNTISMDQLAAAKVGDQTRHPYLCFSTSPGYSPSYTARGVAIPPEGSPARAFANLFINGTPAEVQAEVVRIKQGQSILDRVAAQARKLQRDVGADDRDKLDQYFTSVRELEQRMTNAEAWTKRPKPKTEIPTLKDPGADEQTTRFGLMLDVSRLAIQADLTRVATIYYVGTSKTPSQPGETFAYHDLSHHGQDPGKIAKLTILERDVFAEWGRLLAKLKQPNEAGTRLLDSTTVVMGSGMGNASSHDATNLPLLVAGGRFKHAGHLVHDPKDPPPLCNLWVQVLQQMGLEVDKFGTSKGSGITGLANA